MYKVLLADDESYVTKSIASTIPWKELDLELVYIANNGTEALDYMNTHHVDIVITDVRMPGISGLDLCKQLSLRNKNIKLIIISGYADFAYAQKAIKFGSIGYCLKPIEYEELQYFLNIAVNKLNEKNKNNPINLLDSIESEDMEQIQKGLQLNGINKNKLYVAVTLSNASIDDFKLYNCICLKLGVGKYAYLFENLQEEIQFIRKAMQNSKILGIGYCNKASDLKDLRKDIQFSVNLAYQFFIEGEPSICSERYFSKFAAENINAIRLSLSLNNHDDALKILKEIQKSNYTKLFHIKDALKLCNTIYSSLTTEDDKYIYTFDQLVQEYGSFYNMLIKAINFLSENKTSETNLSCHPNSNFLNIIKYINNNYNNEISIKSVADILNLNPNYISQLFKKETGTTYTKYLMRLRIDKAKELMDNTMLSINEISELAGFNDYFYFLKAFKKYEGISPGKYRKNL